ncbi:MAG: 6-carboxytetrahydropterin synthase [Methanogenium sp.]|jgi:6-pyruvoyl-tetrahydropterin synthase
MEINVGPLTISAAHFIHTCEPNSPCQRLHGHNYTIDISLSGFINCNTCMLIDANDVKRIVDKWDHKTLVALKCVTKIYPGDVELLEITNPTTKKVYQIPASDCVIIGVTAMSAEAMSNYLATEIWLATGKACTVRVTVRETPKMSATSTIHAINTEE